MAGKKQTRTGPLDEVTKTSIRMPRRLLRQVDDLATKLGLSNQSIYTLGTIRMLLELAPLVENIEKRQQMVRKLASYFQKHLEEAKGGGPANRR